MTIPTFKLRAYQDLNVSRICRRILQDGKQHVLYAAPMASGKTLVGKALAARLLGPRFSTVLVLGPSNNIVERWREPVKVASVARNMPPRLYGKTLDRDGKLPRLDTALALHGDGSFWNDDKEGVWVGTRQGVCDQKVIDQLLTMKQEGRDVEHVCVLVDEGHHHYKENQGGKFCKAITDLGGTVVLLTGTPWHSSGALTDDDSGEVHYPWSPYARERDEQGRLIAPQNWRVEHERVQECETDDLSLVVDDGFEAKTDLTDAKRKVMIKRIVARFVADGCPKLVVNVPRRAPWVTELMGALQRSTKVRNALKALKRPALRVFDFTGGSADDAARIADLEALMFWDAETCRRYEDSKIDVIVACARMNEGTDWPLCSHVYNVRIPNSMSLIMQRWSRASRSKNKYAGYPADYANTQTLVFFSPTVTGDVGANFWAKHRNIALATASLLEDYKVTQKYVNVCPSLERFKKAIESGNQTDIDDAGEDLLDEEDHDQEWEGTEHARAQAMAKVVEFIEKRGGKVSVPELAAFIKSKAKGDKEFAADLKQAALVHLERVNPEIATLVREHRAKSRTRTKRGDCGGDLIKRDMEDAWEAVAAKFSHVMVSTPADVKQMAMFTPEDAPQLAERLREGGGGDVEENARAIVAFHEEHGRWPRALSRARGAGPEQVLGRALNHLRRNHPDVCSRHAIPLRAQPDDLWEQRAQEVLAFHKDRGQWPSSSAKDEAEKRLGKIMGGLRANRPDVCVSFGIPLKSRPDDYAKQQAQQILVFRKEHGCWPRLVGATSSESRLGRTLVALRQRHPDVCTAYNIPLRARPDDYTDKQAQDVLTFVKVHGHWPLAGSLALNEQRLARNLKALRAWRPDVCARYGIPLKADRGDSLRRSQGRVQFSTLGKLTPQVCRNYDLTSRSPDIEGDSGAALNNALISAQAKPSKSRGLGYAIDLCQVNSLSRLKLESEHDCWRFTLKGAKKPDTRPWAVLLASGDNKKIESAERVAFLDWENPDTNGKPVRRPWSPPATSKKAAA
jgi:superfamily II DNA or RNA helicase